MNPANLDTHVSYKEAATRSVRKPRDNSAFTAWPKLLWGMALLGLLLLPSHYRAGAEKAHGHSFVQLWIDAGDGTLHHAHHLRASELVPAFATSWFDPLVEDAGSTGLTGLENDPVDVADQQESVPVASGLHLLLMSAPVALLMGALPPPMVSSDRPVAGLSPRIVLPPPRWTP